MAITTLIGLALIGQAAATDAAMPAPTTYDIGYEKLLAGSDAAALEAIEKCEELAENDPARLINSGIALARIGRYEDARASFRAAASRSDRVELETASGQWVDSRELALKALAMLDRGDFARYYALSMR